MNIGIDISQIAYKGTGVARFTHGLVNAILDYDKEDTWTFFFSSFRNKLDKDVFDKITSSRHKLITRPLPPTLLSFLCNDLHLISLILTSNFQPLLNLDWFITSDWSEPKLAGKKATIVHDLVFKKYPETVHPSILATQEKRLKWVSKESNVIFADSQTTATDLLEEYDINKSRVMVNYPGVTISVIPEIKDQRMIIDKFGLKNPYLLTVGKREPRKNIETLITAFEEIKKNYKKPLDLVIVGPKGWGDDVEKQKDINILSYVTDRQLSALYAQATCFVLPSLYEGFGYPIIEAMHHGCPVACSNTSSLSEIAGGAAQTFDPTKPDEIAQTLLTILNDNKLRMRMIADGNTHAKQYSWIAYYNTLITTLKKHS